MAMLAVVDPKNSEQRTKRRTQPPNLSQQGIIPKVCLQAHNIIATEMFREADTSTSHLHIIMFILLFFRDLILRGTVMAMIRLSHLDLQFTAALMGNA